MDLLNVHINEMHVKTRKSVVATDVRFHAVAIDWRNVTSLLSHIGLCTFRYFLKLRLGNNVTYILS